MSFPWTHSNEIWYKVSTYNTNKEKNRKITIYKYFIEKNVPLNSKCHHISAVNGDRMSFVFLGTECLNSLNIVCRLES